MNNHAATCIATQALYTFKVQYAGKTCYGRKMLR